MKLIFESGGNGWGESFEAVVVFELENDEEFWEIETMSHDERCEMIGATDEDGTSVMPGKAFHTYRFWLTGNHLIVTEKTELNV